MYYSKCNLGYVIRAEIGEEIQEAFRQFAEAANIKAGFYTGIGALTQVELAFFCTEQKVYDRRFFEGEYELVSMSGNLSSHDGVIIPHTHVSLGDRDFQTYSGHLVRGVVSVTIEILLVTVDIPLSRKEDPILKYKGLITHPRTHLKIDV